VKREALLAFGAFVLRATLACGNSSTTGGTSIDAGAADAASDGASDAGTDGTLADSGAEDGGSDGSLCSDLVTAVCARACTQCNGGGLNDCCVFSSNGYDSTCPAPASCDGYVETMLCGDGGRDAATFTACQASLPAATCYVDDGGLRPKPGLKLDPVCDPLFR
jgi:hypothetical protein